MLGSNGAGQTLKRQGWNLSVHHAVDIAQDHLGGL